MQPGTNPGPGNVPGEHPAATLPANSGGPAQNPNAGAGAEPATIATPKIGPAFPVVMAPPGSVVASTSEAEVGQPADPSQRQAAPHTPGTPGRSEPPGEVDPLARLAVPALAAADRAAARKPVPMGRIIGNRDFVIQVDCYNDHATITPGGAEFRWPSAAASGTDQILADHVQQLILRRQASVRPGEPPYRPVIRFHVAPDGLRTYYRAYPPLEGLRVPMTRENREE